MVDDLKLFLSWNRQDISQSHIDGSKLIHMPLSFHESSAIFVVHLTRKPSCRPARSRHVPDRPPVGIHPDRAVCHSASLPCRNAHRPTRTSPTHAFCRLGTRRRTCGHRSTNRFPDHACYCLSSGPRRRVHQANYRCRSRRFCCPSSYRSTQIRPPTSRPRKTKWIMKL